MTKPFLDLVDGHIVDGEQTELQPSMGENQEQQEEELEVLKSIYEGDECYTNPDKQKHQYKFGEDSTSRSFILGWYLEIDNTVTLYILCLR